MASDPNKDASGFVIVRMGDKYEIVMPPHDAEAAAKAEAERLAEADEEGFIFAVYAKVGTARAVRKVEWKGRNG